MAHIDYIESTKPVDIVLAVKHLGSGLEIAETLDIMNQLKHDPRGTVTVEIRKVTDFEHAIGFANGNVCHTVDAAGKRKKLKRALREVCAYTYMHRRIITARIDLGDDIHLTVRTAYCMDIDNVGLGLLHGRELWYTLENEPEKVKNLTNLEIRALAELYDYKCFVANMSDDYSVTLHEQAALKDIIGPIEEIARERGLI